MCARARSRIRLCIFLVYFQIPACVHVEVHTYHIHTYTHRSTGTHTYTHVHTCTHIHTTYTCVRRKRLLGSMNTCLLYTSCGCGCAYSCAHTHPCLWVHEYVWMHVCNCMNTGVRKRVYFLIVIIKPLFFSVQKRHTPIWRSHVLYSKFPNLEKSRNIFDHTSHPLDF